MIRAAMLLATAAALGGAAPDAPSDSAEPALRMLLAASSLPAARLSTTCRAVIVGVPRPTLGDRLAVPLAAFDGGENRITGGCLRNRCRVQFTHRGGDEDLFSDEYRFTVARGKLVPASLECLGTL